MDRNFTIEKVRPPLPTRSCRNSTGLPTSMPTAIASTTSTGAQAGVGVKWQMYRNLCLYAELPLSFVLTKTEIEQRTSDDGGRFDQINRVQWDAGYRLNVPGTIYLVLRF